ncbi:Hypothetical protein A7982_05428 [Minicystis rosea]|nr:Hypothetical protein A7982_05428 [Minicystis rosea]
MPAADHHGAHLARAGLKEAATMIVRNRAQRVSSPVVTAASHAF